MVATLQRAGALMGKDLQATEATTESSGGFALITHVETGHPFAPFADARYADFTKIHFWHYRVLKISHPAGATGGSVVTPLATFDSGVPTCWRQGLGKGVVRLLTSGWQPTDSQLAPSSKFLPLMEEMVRRKDAIVVARSMSWVTPSRCRRCKVARFRSKTHPERQRKWRRDQHLRRMISPASITFWPTGRTWRWR